MSTFSEMAEAWMRENIPTMETPQTAYEAIPACDPDAWREDFIRWALERCALRDEHEDAGGIGALHRDFLEWCLKHDAIPCRRAVFEALLTGAGFPIKDGLAVGVTLKAELEAVLRFQNPPPAEGQKGHQTKPAARKGAC